MSQFLVIFGTPKYWRFCRQWDCLFFHFLLKTRSNILDQKLIIFWNPSKSPIFQQKFWGFGRTPKKSTFWPFFGIFSWDPKNDLFFALFPPFPLVEKCSKVRKNPIFCRFLALFSGSEKTGNFWKNVEPRLKVDQILVQKVVPDLRKTVIFRVFDHFLVDFWSEIMVSFAPRSPSFFSFFQNWNGSDFGGPKMTLFDPFLTPFWPLFDPFLTTFWTTLE